MSHAARVASLRPASNIDVAALLRENAELKKQTAAVANANAHAAELMIELEEARDEIALTTAKLRDIVDHVQFGFLIIDRDLRISDEVTRSCTRLFGRPDVASGNLLDVLRLSGNARLGFAMAIEQIFEDVMPEALSLAQVPARFEIDDRILTLSGTALRDADGCIHSVLFSVADATQLEAQQRENERSHAVIGILKRREAFAFYREETRNLLAAARHALEAGDQDTARHALHTIKGNSGCYGLHALARLIHAVEELPAISHEAISSIEHSLGAFLRDNASVLGLDANGEARPDHRIVVNESELSELQGLLGQRDVERALEWVSTARQVPAGRLLGPIEDLVEQTARRYDRRVRIVRKGDQLRVPHERMGSVLSNACHLIRNAIVHGIEDPRDRGAKHAEGEIALELAAQDSHYVLRVSDDGRGIDWDTLVSQALASGKLSTAEAQTLSADARAALLFVDGLSTATATTESAGRGVGMGAVRNAAQAVGGTIHVHSERGRGTTVEVRVPFAQVAAANQPTSAEAVAPMPAQFDKQFFIAAGNEDVYRATLGLATALSAAASGSSVVVFFTMRGAQWTGERDAQLSDVPGFPRIAELIEMLVEAGARLEGCVSCVQHHLDAPLGDNGRKQLANGIHYAGLSEAVMRMDNTPTTVF